MLDPRQIRAALELVNWTTAELAEATELNADTVRRICRGTINRPHEAFIETRSGWVKAALPGGHLRLVYWARETRGLVHEAADRRGVAAPVGDLAEW